MYLQNVTIVNDLYLLYQYNGSELKYLENQTPFYDRKYD